MTKKIPMKNYIAAIVLYATCPILLLAIIFTWIGNKLIDFVSFMLRWMTIWTGVK